MDVNPETKLKQPNFKHLTSKNFGVPPKKQNALLQEVTKPHVESFNYMLQEGLRHAIKDLRPIEFGLPSSTGSGDRVSIAITGGIIRSPRVNQSNVSVTTQRVYPTECREKGTTYRGSLQVSINCFLNNRLVAQFDKIIGQIPIMVKSEACNLAGLSPAGLIKHGEEMEEMGGYFIVNGNEKVVRMLIMQRRNYPLCLKRNGWKSRGPFYTEYGVQVRSVKKDQSSSSCILHYLSNGSAMLEFGYQKDRFFVPIIFILKAVLQVSDKYIYDEMIRGYEDDTYFKGCIVNMLREALKEKLFTKESMLDFIGDKFRVKLNLPDWYTNVEIAEFLLRTCICVHLDSDKDKFNFLVYMTQKLFVFSKGKCAEESPDNPMNQEVLLSGHLYLIYLKERLEGWLLGAKINIDKMARHAGVNFNLDSQKFLVGLNKVSDVTQSMNYFLATGNLKSASGLNLMQQSGLSVVADKLNFMRYISHFRCVHRGAFFTEMRTTTVRKLRPEAWGFLCPVHTPDGTPCGLMNHLAALCSIQNFTSDISGLPDVLYRLGVIPLDSPLIISGKELYTVILDGKLIGYIHQDSVVSLTDTIRSYKTLQQHKVPSTLEICYIAKSKYASQFPGVYLFSNVARMIRPVINLAHERLEYIGSFEQVYLNISVTPSEAHEGITTHEEINEQSMLSIIASLTPFSDFNQSPRNMYQCQMGKQTLGTPLHAYRYRADNKLYRLQTPQSPLVRPAIYDQYNMDEYPIGTNAVVAVISYTGYDMEDAMVINKSSFERGYGHGTVYKTEIIDLQAIPGESTTKVALIFGKKEGEKENGLDSDGLPYVGKYLVKGDAYYSYINLQTGSSRITYYKSDESAYVEQIKLLGDDTGNSELQKIAIVLRVPRNPVIGDKFSSRHGQKGICSMMWPVEDMPFTETGMTPDVIFNPHGFPSRMTIGMMIESMAGKSSACHGLCHDATPFTFSEDEPAINHFGEMLTEAGYNYHGTERLYSGTDGRELEVDIFFGIVYYQRLRHMVSDKFQVRSTGPVDVLTHQPVKGRKKAGGVRFGEMERDALIAHGTPFLLHDRLFNCSDKSLARLCTECQSLLSPVLEKPKRLSGTVYDNQTKWTCSLCKKQDTIQVISVPYVFQVLVAEMAAMGLKVVLDVK